MSAVHIYFMYFVHSTVIDPNIKVNTTNIKDLPTYLLETTG